MPEGKKTTLEPGLIRRVGQSLRYLVTARQPDVWMGPGEPQEPAAPPEVKGRTWDYPTGVNLRFAPRGDEGVSFAEMRLLADNCDLVRLAVETRKDQMHRLRWALKAKKEREVPEAVIREATELLERPDRLHDWDTWLRLVMEDMLVIDAATVYMRPTRGGRLYGLEPVDGATIRPWLDDSGRMPIPPEKAYGQYLKGVIASDYTTEELIYFPRNPRTWKLYGFSPVEQVIVKTNVALRRDMHLLAYYTEGNIPEAFGSLPENWTVDQIKQFQEYWDAYFESDAGRRRKMKWGPKGMDPVFTRNPELKDEMDEWLARVVCMAFSISPLPFVKMMNRATGEQAQETAEEEGQNASKKWVKSLIDRVLAQWYSPDLEFAWEEEEETDSLKEAQTNEIYLRTGVLLPNEVREALGRQALEEPPAPPSPPAEAEKEKDKEEQPPEVKQPEEDGGGGDPELAKIALSEYGGLTPVNRDRAAMVRLRVQLAGVLTEALQDEAQAAAQEVTEALAELRKAEEDEVERALQTLKFTGFALVVDQVEEILIAAALEGVEAGAVQLGMEISLDQANRLAVEWARERAAELVGRKWVDGLLVDNPNPKWAITDSTREMLRADVAQAIEEGWSTQQLAQKFEENYAFSRARARTVARTEIGSADVAGNLRAYQVSGVVVGKRSLLGSEHMKPDICDTNAAAGVIPLEEPFPSGHQGPLYHPNCVCDVVPVTKEGGLNL